MIKITHNLKFVVTSLFVIFALVSCSSPTYLDARDSIKDNVDEVTDLLKPAHVVVTDEAFIDTKPLVKNEYPEWTNRKFSIKLNRSFTLKIIMDKLFKGKSKIKVMYQGDLSDDDDTVDLVVGEGEYTGRLVDIIDKIAKKLNFHYMIDGNNLIWARHQTKIFQLGIPPGMSKYKMGSGSEQLTSTYKVGQGYTVGSDQKGGYIVYESDSFDKDVWDNLEQTVISLSSYRDQGSSRNENIQINKSNATLTVTDKPSNIAAIERYVEEFNKFNMQQVGVKIQVLEVELDDEYKRGIDWNVLRETIRSSINFDFNLGNAPNTLGSLTGTSGGNLIWNILDPTASDPNASPNNYAGSGVSLIQYIEQQGNVSIISEPRFTVMNNQAAEIKIVRDRGYVYRRSNSVTQGGTTQEGVEPGSIKTGFSLYIVPTIFEGKVLLQITTSLSRQLALDNIEDVNNNTVIQLPTISDRRFTQRSVVPNNATLVLTGFKENSNGTGDISPFKTKIAGGQSAVNRTSEVVILVTPVIIRA